MRTFSTMANHTEAAVSESEPVNDDWTLCRVGMQCVYSPLLPQTLPHVSSVHQFS